MRGSGTSRAPLLWDGTACSRYLNDAYMPISRPFVCQQLKCMNERAFTFPALPMGLPWQRKYSEDELLRYAKRLDNSRSENFRLTLYLVTKGIAKELCSARNPILIPTYY